MFFSLSKERFLEEAARGLAGVSRSRLGAAVAIPLGVRLLSDQLTPVLAYRRLVVQDQRTAPSFLLESVEGGERQGRHSILGAHPVIEVVAREHKVRVTDRRGPTWNTRESDERDPLLIPEKITGHLTLHLPSRTPGDGPLPSCFLGGWAGFAGYDTVRYAEPEKLPFSKAPADDRKLPDLHFGFYDEVVIFDHVDKAVHIVRLVEAPAESTPDSLGVAYDHACAALERTLSALQTHSKPLPPGVLDVGHRAEPGQSNMTRDDHALMLEKAREYIKAGDIFQVVLGQRFERKSKADPFDVYRALRAVNPSPYMAYMQCEGCILVASSPEILCRVRRSGGVSGGTALRAVSGAASNQAVSADSPPHRSQSGATPDLGSESRATNAHPTFILTNRPLAGTRRRGDTPEHDLALERELLADEKERSEHIMLVDLGRNDVGVVARPGTVRIPHVMEIERYSHVMHISSTVTGELREGVGCWEALRACLPVGTISGAPKIRAMQVIDELEPLRRGPYGGGLGYAGLNGEMDIALALRTIVVPTSLYDGQTWTYHLQASGGIVADSQPEPEFMETVNKAAALVRAIDVAERAFAG